MERVSEIIVDCIYYGSLSHLLSRVKIEGSIILERLVKSIKYVDPERFLHNLYIYLSVYRDILIPQNLVDEISQICSSKEINLRNRSLLRLCICLIYFHNIGFENIDEKWDFEKVGDGKFINYWIYLKSCYLKDKTNVKNVSKQFKSIICLTSNVNLDTAKLNSCTVQRILDRLSSLIQHHPLYVKMVLENYLNKFNSPYQDLFKTMLDVANNIHRERLEKCGY